MSEGETAHDRLKVFISYSRRDMGIADKLVEALEEAGFAVTIDRRDLPYGEEWQGELADFIRGSDTVVWLVSPSSLESRWCNWELGEVQRINKRLIPVAIRPVAPEALPEALGRIHVLPVEGAFDFDRHLATLVEVLNTDRGWLKEHTRLADRARQWLARDRSTALLLRGVALKDAQSWADKKPRAAPAPSDDILQLLLASRLAQTRRQRISVAASLAAAVIGIGLAGVATWQWVVAEERAVAEQAAKEEAQRNFDTARQTVDSVVFDLAQGLRNAEGMRVESIRRVLDQARGAVDRLAATAPDNVDLLRSRAAMLAEFGDTYLAAGDGAGASAAYDESLAILEQLAAADPGHLGRQRDLSIGYERIGDVRVAQGNLAAALESFDAGRAISERLIAADPDSAQWQRGLSVDHIKMGDVYMEQGRLAEALESYEASHTILERLATDDPDDAGRQNDLSVSHSKIGNVRIAQGDLAGALESQETSLAIVERLAAADPGNTAMASGRAISLIKVGDLRVAQGNLVGALENYQESLRIRERLAASDPDNAKWQRDLSASHNNIGDVQGAQGNLAESRESHLASLAISERLATMDPGNMEWQRDLSVSHSQLGIVRFGEGNLAEALESFETAHAIDERLAAMDPDNMEWQRDLSLSHDRIGAVRTMEGDLAGALESHLAGLEIAERLAAADPGNTGWQRDVARSHQWIGDVRIAQGNVRGALVDFAEGLSIVMHLAEADPDNWRSQSDVVTLLNKIGDAWREEGNLQRAVESYELSVAIADGLGVDPTNALWQRELGATLNRLAWMLASGAPSALLDGPRAVDLAKRANELSGWAEPHYLDTLAAAHARAGDFGQAVEWQTKAIAHADFTAADASAVERLESYKAGTPWPVEREAATSP